MTKWFWAAAWLVACTDKTPETGDTGAEATLTVLGDPTVLPAAALLSLWGSAHDDVFIVGSDDGSGPVVLHWDGAAWAKLDTGTTGDLWWAWSDGGDVVYMVGDGGRLVTYTRSTGAFAEEVIADPAYKLFGIWGSSPTDLWVAAAQTENGLDGAVYHYDGASWTQSTLIPRKEGDGGVTRRQAFKVWGSGPSDVWVVGTFGMVMHYDGAGWTDIRPEPVNNTTTLTTVAGSGPDNVYAVGGFGNAIVAHWDGVSWTDDSPPPTDIVPFFNGVSVTDDQVVACGGSGAIYHRVADQWAPDPRPRATGFDFHACWLDELGAVWAVGGDLSSQTAGVIVYGGDDVEPISTL
jgi:hypothetical protein